MADEQSIQQLREKKSHFMCQAKKLLDDKGEQVWSKDDHTKYDEFMNQAEMVDKQIKAHERMLNQLADNQPATLKDTGGSVQNTRALQIFLRKKAHEYTEEDRVLIANTMSTGQGSQGGFTVQPTVAPLLIETLKDFGGMRRIASRLVTANGVDMSYPGSDGTSEIGEIVGQNQQVSDADPVLGTVALNTVKFSSKGIGIPLELIQDTSVDLIDFVQRRLRSRIGRIQNQKFTVGSGVGEPNGLITAAQVGRVGAAGQTTTITYDDLVELIESIDDAYSHEGAFTWNMGQALRKVVRKLKDSAGRPIWTPRYDAGIAGGFTDELLGYAVNINNDMPAPAANAKPLSFGLHDRYMIRDAMDVTIFRFDDSAYIRKGQIGFLALCRAGGNLLDPAAVRLYQHSAS